MFKVHRFFYFFLFLLRDLGIEIAAGEALQTVDGNCKRFKGELAALIFHYKGNSIAYFVGINNGFEKIFGNGNLVFSANFIYQVIV